MRKSPVLFSIFIIWAFCPFSAQAQERVDYLERQNVTGIRGGNLVVAVTADPSNYNRMFASGLSNAAIAERLSADLVHINRSDLQLEPSLAAQWEADKAGRIYTIHLRRGIRFSDSSPFTADDVIFTFQVLSDPKTQSSMAGQLEIDGAFPAVTKIDDFTVQISFQRPVGMGLRMLDSVPILPKKVLLKAYQEGRLAEAWGAAAKPEDVVGLGPFRLKECQRGVKVVLERNPYYWKKDRAGQILPYLDSITYLIIPDLNAQALRFGQGELDLANQINPENYAAMRRTANRYTLRDLGPGLAMDFLWFNLNRNRNSSAKDFVDPEKQAIFEKAEFRRAISYALNRKGLNTSILLGLGTPQYGPISSGNKTWYHAGISKTEYDLSRARKLLEQAGLKDTNGDGILEYGSKRQPFTLALFTARGNNVREKLSQVIQDNLSQIGIRVAVQQLLPNELASRFLKSFDYEAILFAFTPTDVAPDLQTDMWYSSGELHFWCPSQAKPERPWEAALDSLVSSLIKRLEPEGRKSDFNQVQELWAREMPAIPTIAPNILVGWNNRLNNVRPSILTPHLLWNADEICKRDR
jgi:peptide/nickel transport system substrate-binding protein